MQGADDSIVASGEEEEDPGGDDEGQGEDGEVEGEQDGREGGVENHGDENCKQMEGERSGGKMINDFNILENLREGWVKKTVAPAVSRGE